MRWLPASLWARLCVAFLLAAGGVAALHAAVVARERHRPQPKRSTAAATTTQDAAATATSSGAPAPAPAPDPASEPVRRGAIGALGVPLHPLAGVVLLATRLEAIPPDLAPVVQVLPDGALALRRPAPVATRPGPAAPSRDGIGGAVLVPRSPLPEWTPAARGALVEVLGAWLADRPVPAARVRSADVPWSAAELGRLLTWVP